jgi:hypothetical protein
VAEDFIDDNSSKVKSNFVPSEQRRAEYKRTYERLMERAKGRVKIKGVHDNHHIVPKSLGGSNEKSNIAVLTYDEHFLAHWLLTKFTEGKARISMLKALSEMKRAGKNHKNRVVSGWQYSVTRRARSEAMTLWLKTPEGQNAAKKGGAGQRAFYETQEGQEVAKKRGRKLSAFYATPEGQEALRQGGATLSAFYATPEGQEVVRERGKKGGATLRAFYATPEGQQVAKKAGATRRAFYATPEGQEAAKKIGATRRAFYATPKGQEVVKEAGQKAGATAKARGSRAGENHPNAKVTEETVRQIRAFEGSHVEAARYFDVTREMSYQIRTGRTWKHIK